MKVLLSSEMKIDEIFSSYLIELKAVNHGANNSMLIRFYYR